MEKEKISKTVLKEETITDNIYNEKFTKKIEKTNFEIAGYEFICYQVTASNLQHKHWSDEARYATKCYNSKGWAIRFYNKLDSISKLGKL